jgi:uncharacterized membrane protein
MNLRNATFLALVGMLILTVLMAFDFIHTVLAVVRGLIPALAIFRSAIHLFASLCVTVFFFVFHRTHS